MKSSLIFPADQDGKTPSTSRTRFFQSLALGCNDCGDPRVYPYFATHSQQYDMRAIYNVQKANNILEPDKIVSMFVSEFYGSCFGMMYLNPFCNFLYGFIFASSDILNCHRDSVYIFHVVLRYIHEITRRAYERAHRAQLAAGRISKRTLWVLHRKNRSFLDSSRRNKESQQSCCKHTQLKSPSELQVV